MSWAATPIPWLSIQSVKVDLLRGEPSDLERARELSARYADLRLGLVDGVVIAVAERLGAEVIATLDLRDFGSVEILGGPRLLPRDGR